MAVAPHPRCRSSRACSHCDVGWLKTPEDYYTSEVVHIFDTVTRELDAHPDYRFQWAETAWLYMWTANNRSRIDTLRRLIERGQLEVIGGGWTQNDEGATHYEAVAEQMSVGHQWLLENLGVRPVAGWQIDPFGASSATPHLFGDCGFRSLVIDRISLPTQIDFALEQRMEFWWRPYPAPHVRMFTHVLDKLYSSPVGCDWEGLVVGYFPSTPITDANVAARSEALLLEISMRAAQWRTRNVLLPFGGDFHFQNASVQFGNMSKLIGTLHAVRRHIRGASLLTPRRCGSGGCTAAAYINRDPKSNVHIRYAALSEYFAAVANESVQFPSFEDDFFPYEIFFNSYFSGSWGCGRRCGLHMPSAPVPLTVRACRTRRVLYLASRAEGHRARV